MFEVTCCFGSMEDAFTGFRIATAISDETSLTYRRGFLLKLVSSKAMHAVDEHCVGISRWTIHFLSGDDNWEPSYSASAEGATLSEALEAFLPHCSTMLLDSVPNSEAFATLCDELQKALRS
jgi:hypothetical protein